MLENEARQRLTFSGTTPDTDTNTTIRDDAAQSTAPPAESETPAGDYSNVHSVLRNVDYWFEREVGTIRREAERLAAEWAAGNLPGLTDKRVEVLDTEKVLAHSCESLWQAWPERTKVQMQGAVDSATGELSREVANARAAITEALIAGDELKEAESKIDSVRRSQETGNREVKYGAQLGKISFWLLAIVLVVVEFMANHPVFRIIFPLPANLELKMAEVTENALGAGGWGSGVRLAALEISSYVEATALALIIVIVLVVCAKSAGAAVRAMTTLKEDDYSFAAASIRSLHRQAKTVLLVSTVVAVCIVGFLYNARNGAPDLVEGRRADAKATVAAAQAELDAVSAAGPSREGELSGADARVSDARVEVGRQEDRLAFARTVATNNGGILLLNVALIGAAFLIGFLKDARDLTETIGEDADIVALKQKCLATREQVRRLTDRARSGVMGGDAAHARTNSLLRSDPLATLDAKRATLSAIIPTWREVNARIRRIDPSNIVAFQQPVVLNLIDISDSVRLQTPETLGRALAELDQLRSEVNRVERIVDSPIGLVA